jgi:hypothetical protein
VLRWLDDAQSDTTRGNIAPSDAARALDRVEPPTRELIRGCSPLSWIDFPHHHRVITAVHAELGADAFDAWYCEVVQHILRLPLFEGLMQPLVRLMGRRAMVVGFPRGWDLVMRDAGKLSVHQPEDEPAAGTTVRFENVPVALAQDAVYHASLRGVLRAVMIRGGYPGVVRLDASAVDNQILRYHMLSNR